MILSLRKKNIYNIYNIYFKSNKNNNSSFIKSFKYFIKYKKIIISTKYYIILFYHILK